jgi:hypothetical protein
MSPDDLKSLLQYTRDICTLLDNKNITVHSDTVEFYHNMRIASRSWRDWAYNQMLERDQSALGKMRYRTNNPEK